MKPLTSAEIDQAQSIIDNASPGTYELCVLYGPKWKKVAVPTTFGKRFKEAVEAGRLRRITQTGVRDDDVKTNNHNVYIVLERS